MHKTPYFCKMPRILVITNIRTTTITDTITNKNNIIYIFKSSLQIRVTDRSICAQCDKEECLSMCSANKQQLREAIKTRA